GESFNSERIQAEPLWDTLDKIGKKCIVLNYPGAWPSKMKNGVMVGGSGLTVGEYRDGFERLDSLDSLCGSQLITTGIYPFAIRGEFKDAQGWENLPEVSPEPLEMEAKLMFPTPKDKPADATWYVLAHQTDGEDYDRASLSPTKNFNDAFCTLAVGQWSPKITTRIKMEDGSEQEVFFRCKLLELSDDAEDFRFLIGELCSLSGCTSPAEIAEELVSEEGTFGHAGGMRPLILGWFDLDTYAETNEIHDQFNGDVAVTLMNKDDWDLFYMHSHPPDWLYHAIINFMDPDTTPDKDLYDKAWETHLKIYQSQDRLIAKIIEAAGQDTLVILVSDHGATPDGPTFDPYMALAPAGLITIETPKSQPGEEVKLSGFGGKLAGLLTGGARPHPVLEKSKAIPQRSCHVYVNLKGRDSGGVVEPEDYKKVQQEIIDAFLTYVDPGTGKRPVALALSKKDARILGLYGDNIGDVIYAIYPWFGGQHGSILPTAEWGVGSLKGLFTMTGPGVKKGYRLKRTTWLPDLVPTICYLMNWPVPDQAEGAVIYQAFEEPNFRFKGN
ncbi:MAG: alkaline phosphatase family protein, partial [Deltaproteobacteria bacterium]|nr:alkaline phosphatase family protein [Deltaproteobacteria bacterium]